MESEHAPNEAQTTNETRPVNPLWWVLLGVAIVLVLASFTGGPGMFGWGWMIGMMGFWMLMPVLLIVFVVVLVMQQQQRQG